MTGKWKPGQSGNPTGRTPGHGEVGKLRAAIAKHVPEILEKQIELAKGGDAQAARLLLERVLPPIKATEQTTPMELPDGSLTAQGRAVLLALSGGELAPAQASQVLAALASLAKLIETDDLAARIASLEERNAQKP